MLTMIKYLLYLTIALMFFYIVRDISATQPQKKIEQTLALLNRQIEDSVQNLISQFNGDI